MAGFAASEPVITCMAGFALPSRFSSRSSCRSLVSASLRYSMSVPVAYHRTTFALSSIKGLYRIRNHRYLPSFPRALLVFERHRSRETFLALFAESLNVFWMEHAITEVIGAHFIQGQPRVLKCHAICVNGLAVGIQNHDCLWNKVNDSPQLFFVRTEFGLS